MNNTTDNETTGNNEMESLAKLGCAVVMLSLVEASFTAASIAFGLLHGLAHGLFCWAFLNLLIVVIMVMGITGAAASYLTEEEEVDDDDIE